MKKNYIFLSVLLFVFSLTTTQAQEILATISGEKWVEYNEHNGLIVAAGDNYNDMSIGDVQVLQQDTNGDYTVITHLNFENTSNIGGNPVVNLQDQRGSILIRDNGDIFIQGTTSTIAGGSQKYWHTVRRYNLASGVNPLAEKTVYNGVPYIFEVNGQLYVLLNVYDDGTYNPLSSGWNVPATPGATFYLFPIDTNFNMGAWYTALPGIPDTGDKFMLQMNAQGNLVIKVDYTDTYEIDPNNGNLLGRFFTDPTERFWIDPDNGEILRANGDYLYRHSANKDLLFVTDLPEPVYNKFQSHPGIVDVKKRGDSYLIFNGNTYTMGKNMTHGEAHYPIVPSGVNGSMINRYMKQDGSLIFMRRDGSGPSAQIYVYTGTHIETNTPQLNSNSGDSNVVSVHNGQVYNHDTNSWETRFHESTIVVNTLPAVGSSVDSNWYINPSGYADWAWDVEDVTRLKLDGSGYETKRCFRVHFYKNGMSDQIMLKVNFELASTVGVQELTQNEFTVYPVPAQNVLNINSEKLKLNTIDIYNTLGQLLLKKEFYQTNNIYQINVSGLKPATYFIKMYDENGIVQSSKFIKK